MTVELTRRLFTADEYHRLAEVGVLASCERVELIDGEIVVMSPIGHRHSRCVAYLNTAFVRGLGDRAVVWPQLSLRLGTRLEPEPDLVLLRPPLDRYAERLPGAPDALLVVEVSDTSLAYDREVKLPRYAAAGVPEAWIVDLEGGVVEVHREPSPDGYRWSRRRGRGEEVAPAAFPDVRLDVADIVGG